MTELYNKLIQIGSFISDGILPDQRKVRFYLSQRDGTERAIFDLKDIFFLPSSLYNLVSLALLNNHDIFHNNKNKTLYNLKIKEVLAQVRC